MSWRDALLVQARSDLAMLDTLNAPRNARDVEDCHRLHYLQMGSEKLARAMLSKPDGTTPPPVHSALVRMLQVLKGRAEVRRRLGYQDREVFKKYVDSLLPLAREIERLAPALAGMSRPNPEYPWYDAATGQVIAPAAFAFPEFQPSPQMAKIRDLINRLLAWVASVGR